MPSGEFSYTKKISTKQIKQVWQKEYPGKRMPKVEGYVLPAKDFRSTISHFRQVNGHRSEVMEYGKRLPMNRTVGAVFRDPNTKSFVIIRHEKASGSMTGTIKHELGHIARKEVGRF